MRRILSAFMALALLGTAGTALAQRIDQDIDGTNYIGDEPNVLAPGTLPHNIGGSPSADFPADANGLGLARRDTAAPILSVVWNTELVQRIATTSSLLQRFTGDNYLVPGTGTFNAWHGVFQDLNGNGRIDDGNRAFDRAHTSANLECGGDAGLGVVSTGGDANGLGKPQGANTGVSLRCARADEWSPAAASVPIVAYVTPGDWRNYCGDWINKWSHPDIEADGCGEISAIDPPRGSGPESPDFTFQGIATEGESTGVYYAPGSGFDYLVLDNSLLMTTVIEAISSAVLAVDEPRTHKAGPNSLVEVDLYKSVDPLVEGLYQTTVVQALADTGCGYGELEYLNLGCRKTTDPFTEPVRKGGAGVAAGPVTSQVFTPFEQCPNRACAEYDEPHLFLDLYMVNTRAIYGVALNSPGEIGREMDPLAGGETRPFGAIKVDAVFGVWTDVNGDGFIGEPHSVAECDDGPYLCGSVQQPHQWGPGVAPDEFLRTCGAQESLGEKAVGSFAVTLTPDSPNGDWGTAIYVATDRRTATNQNDDNLRDDGRGMFNPWDDLVLDVADADLQVQSIVTNGAIELHLTCSGVPGQYEGYEMLFFVAPPAHDVIVTAEHGLAFTVGGVDTDERVAETDVWDRFTLA